MNAYERATARRLILLIVVPVGATDSVIDLLSRCVRCVGNSYRAHRSGNGRSGPACSSESHMQAVVRPISDRHVGWGLLIQGGRKMNMQQNCTFATPSTPHPGQPKPNPAYLDQYGGCCKQFWGQVGDGGMTVLVSNLDTQNRDFTVLTWVLKLLTSPSGMVRFHSQVKRFRARGVR